VPSSTRAAADDLAFQIALDSAATEVAHAFNCSVYIGAAGPGIETSLVAAAGNFDRFDPSTKQAEASDLIPGGSITKAFTATFLLQLAEEGKMDLDKPAVSYIDPWLLKHYKPPLSILWADSSGYINSMTVRQIMQMRAGLNDYDDQADVIWTLYSDRARDWEPLEGIIYGTNRTFLWPPGQGGGFYSGTGYVILGLLLCSVTGVDTWDQLDQAAIFKRLAQADSAVYDQNLLFMKRGPCSQYGPRVIPQYLTMLPFFGIVRQPADTPMVADWPPDLLTNKSCLNGYTMGNGLITAGALAQFYVDLQGSPGKLLSAESLSQMNDWKPLTVGGDPPVGTPYGLGQMLDTIPYGDPPGNLTFHVIGHAGEDWGSGFAQAGWVAELQLGIAIGFNMGEKHTGMNTSITVAENDQLENAVLCRVIVAAALFRGHPPTDCSRFMPPGWR
jgi:CubicO group peptidase (beta-lactamase class C family)